MKRPAPILAAIAREHLLIPTLKTRRSDSLDFHEVAVWQVEAALKAAFAAGSCSSLKNAQAEGSMTAQQYSPSPWSYEYNPYTSRSGAEIPAFEIFDADCNKVFDTNEDTPCDLQEANARIGAAAPRLLATLMTCTNLLADYEESEGEEGEAYREALAAIAEASGRAA